MSKQTRAKNEVDKCSKENKVGNITKNLVNTTHFSCSNVKIPYTDLLILYYFM